MEGKGREAERETGTDMKKAGTDAEAGTRSKRSMLL